MATRQTKRTESRSPSEACTVTVVYEDIPTRDLAIQLCDVLVRRFLDDVEFDFTWWRFDYLADAQIAKEAARAAVKSDLILVSVHSTENVPLQVKAWFEHWLAKRKPTKGALAVVQTSAPGDSKHSDDYLKRAAERAKLDYLPLSNPSAISRPVDRLREDDVFTDTSRPNSKANDTYHSSGWGINE